MTFDLTDCSIVIPVEIDSKERLEHVTFLYEYFNKYFFNHQLIFVEHGKEPKLPFARFMKSDSEFSTSRVSNYGVTFVKHRFFCKCDADALVHPKAIFDAFQILKNDPSASFILPYNGLSFDIQDPLRSKILDSFHPDALPFIENEEHSSENIRLKNGNSTGLIHVFRTDLFKDLGGYNEEFIGWGYEDEEIVARFDKMSHPRILLNNYTAFHFNHPRKMGDSVQVFKNYYRYLYVKNLPPEDVAEYIKSWNLFFPR